MNSKFQKKIWDDHFANYKLTDNFLKSRYDYLLNYCKRIKKTGKLLEIGYGNGYFLYSAKNKNYDVYGTDICTKNKLTSITTFNSDITKKINWGSNFFDLIVASEVLEHIPQSKIIATLTEIKRVLKKDGCFVGTVPLNEKLDASIVCCPYCDNKFHKWGHENTYSIDKLSLLFLQNGFEIVKIKPLFITSKYDNLWVNKKAFAVKLSYFLTKDNLNCGNIFFCVRKI